MQPEVYKPTMPFLVGRFRPHRAETYNGLVFRSPTISIQKDKPFTNSAAQKYNNFFYQQLFLIKFFENF